VLLVDHRVARPLFRWLIIVALALAPYFGVLQIGAETVQLCQLAASTTQEEVAQVPEVSQVPDNVDERTKQLAAELAPLASDMWGTERRLEQEGYRVDGGNKSPTGWWLTANNKNITPGGIRVRSDGTKIVVTVEQ